MLEILHGLLALSVPVFVAYQLGKRFRYRWVGLLLAFYWLPLLLLVVPVPPIGRAVVFSFTVLSIPLSFVAHRWGRADRGW